MWKRHFFIYWESTESALLLVKRHLFLMKRHHLLVKRHVLQVRITSLPGEASPLLLVTHETQQRFTDVHAR